MLGVHFNLQSFCLIGALGGHLPANILTVFKALGDEGRKTYLVRILLARKASSEATQRLNKTLDRCLQKNGFREVHRQPIPELASAILRLAKDNAELWAHLAFVWREFEAPLASAVQLLARARSLCIVPPGGLTGTFGRFADDELEGLVATLRPDCPSAQPLDLAFTCCVMLGRCPARDDGLQPQWFEDANPRQSDSLEAPAPAIAAPQPLPPAPPVDGSTSQAHADNGLERWQPLLEAAQSWPEDAKEWDLADRFTARVSELARLRIAGRGAARRQVAALLAELRHDCREPLQYLGVASEVDGWSLDRVAPAAYDELKAAIQPLQQLARAVGELPPAGKSFHADAERLRRLSELKAQLDGAMDRVRALLGHSAESPSPPPPVSPNTEGGIALSEPREAPAPAVTPPPVATSSPALTPAPAATPAPAPIPAAAAVAPVPAAIPAPPLALAKPALTPAPAKAPAELPAELRSWEAFHATHWVTPGGACEPGPWLSPSFAASLAHASVRELQDDRLGRLLLLARGAESLGAEPAIDSADVVALAALIGQPTSMTAGIDPKRSAALRADTVTDASRWRVKLFLEALRPSLEASLTVEEEHALADRIRIRDGGLRTLVSALFQLAARGMNPVSALRLALETVPITPGEAVGRLEEARRQFYAEVRANWSAAGGCIERSHCRTAWSQFIEECSPLFKKLYPPDRGGENRWSPADLAREITGIVSTHDGIAERAGAHFVDRARMDRHARQLADAAGEVNSWAERAWRQGGRGDPLVGLVNLDQLRLFLTGPAIEPAEEELCRRAAASQLLPRASNATTAPVAITYGDLLAYPDLLATIPSLDLTGSLEERWTPASELIPASAVTDAVRAACYLLQAPLVPPGAASTQPEPHLAALLTTPSRRWLVPLARKLLGRSAPRPQEELRVYEAISRLGDTCRMLSEVAHERTAEIRTALTSAQERAAVAPPTELISWLDSVGKVAAAMLDDRLQRMHQEATSRGLQPVLKALQERRIGDAFFLLHEDHAEGSTARATRETRWRKDARTAYPNPQETISRETEELFGAWLKSSTPQNDAALRLAFAKAVFADLAEPERELVRISCERLRERFAELNPTFVPQLARFQHIVVHSAPVRPATTNFVNSTVGLVAKHPNSLSVVLAPQLKESVRQETIAECRKSGRTAALVDDLDLCRIFDLGGRRRNLALALAEVALEQLPWSAHLTPFSTADGQNTLVEMYVGRQEEAKRIALTPEISRIFSGRKLGKSALLKFIRERYDKRELPSGNILRVLLISVVGAEQEGYVVQLILDELKRRFQLMVPGVSIYDPADRLLKAADKFLQERKRESLLIVLDEADQFVAAQVEANDEHREKCLSWRMRTAIEGHQGFKDSQGFPRVRFLFSGYRTTNTTSGAWGNWGSVLALPPLAPDDAANLISGPLARLGVDASREALGIAWRCGYQPAVLQHFGDRLLSRIEARTPVASREHVLVTPADVSEVFAEEAVRNEIRTVLRNNFQDSAQARIVFYSLAKAFSDQPAGHAFPEPENAVLEILEAVDPDLAWLHPEPDARALEVARMVDDFTQRKLVVRKGDGLHFGNPHHLPIILPGDPMAFLRQEIRGLRQGTRGSADQPARALISETERLNLRQLTTSPPDLGFAFNLVVVGTHWPEAFGHAVGGLPARLGFNPEATVDPKNLLKEPKRVPLAVTSRARLKLADRLAEDRPPNLPPPLFVGGAALLRETLRRRREPKRKELYEVCAPGRFDQPTTRWWFERVRCLSFGSDAWIGGVMRATGGIPILLRHFDGELLGSAKGAGEVTEQMLSGALIATKEAAPGLAKLLGDAEKEEFYLAPRERQLMRMVHRVGEAAGYTVDRLIEDLSDCWVPLYSGTATEALNPGDGDDRAALEMLVRLGLLPENRTLLVKDDLSRVALPPRDDPFYALAGALGQG